MSTYFMYMNAYIYYVLFCVTLDEIPTIYINHYILPRTIAKDVIQKFNDLSVKFVKAIMLQPLLETIFLRVCCYCN